MDWGAHAIFVWTWLFIAILTVDKILAVTYLPITGYWQPLISAYRTFTLKLLGHNGMQLHSSVKAIF